MDPDWESNNRLVPLPGNQNLSTSGSRNPYGGTCLGLLQKAFLHVTCKLNTKN